MSKAICALLLVIVLQWCQIAALASEPTPPAGETTFLVECSPAHPKVKVSITGPLVDHYRVTVWCTDMQGSSRRLVKYCEYEPQATVMFVDASSIESVQVDAFADAPVAARQVK